MGIIIVDALNYDHLEGYKESLRLFYKVKDTTNDIIIVKNEKNLIKTVILMIFKLDPDILAGFDMEKKSLYYLAKRAWDNDIDFLSYISRAPARFEEVF